ncbi:MAG: hypothetical protein ABI461_05170 [Polyangiaceae bacterium]
MKSTKTSIVLGLVASTLLAMGTGCSSGSLDIPGDGQGGGSTDPGAGGGGGGGTGPAAVPPLCTTTGKTYTGFGGSTLGADRVADLAGNDRSRLKPYSALPAEYNRVSGLTTAPVILTSSASTFGSPPMNWYQEPSSSAIVVYSAYRAAFQDCLMLTNASGAAQYQTAPTAASATTECTTWTRKFWSRDATPDELTTCGNVATNDTSTITDVNKRWAYVCASVMTSAGFMSY